MSRIRTIASILLFVALVPTIALAATKATLVGKIVDPSGKPVEGVTVTVTSPDLPNFKAITTTDRKGVFTVDFEKIEVTYQYRFDKTGFQSTESQQTWHREGTEFHDWTMPLAAVAAPTVQGVPTSTSAPAVEAFNTGLAAFKTKDYATAEPKFKEAVANDPNLRQAWEALAVVQLELGHNQDAAASGDKAVALGSTQESVLQARWQAYRNLKDETRAAEALKDLERIGRRAEEAKKVHNEAVALAKAGDNAGAFAKFQEAVNIDPNLQVAQLGLATAASKIGKNAEAEAAAEAILESDPKNEAAVRIRYNAALALGDKAKLISALEGLAVYEPTTGRDGLLRLAFEAYDANDLNVARDRFTAAVAIDPNYGPAYYYLGVINASQGKNGEARKQLQRFLELAPKDREADSAREMLKYLGK